MALSDLLRTLEQEAAACTEEVRSRARREAERVRAEADAQREDRRSSALNAAEAELRTGTAREVEGSRRAAAARRLEARGTALARIRARVERRLDARADDIGLLFRYPPVDLTVDRIGDLLDFDLPQLLAGGTRGAVAATPVFPNHYLPVMA